ncbi:MAG: pyruvate, water dikinase regulatory protein [Rickettsiales bacterium]
MAESTKIYLYLVSDSSGETVISVSAACFAQFEGLEVEKFIWPLLRSKLHFDKLILEVEKNPGIVLYTVANDELRAYLEAECKRVGGYAISAIGHLIEKIQGYLGVNASLQFPGAKQLLLNSEYFKRMEAINFTLMHDDGKLPKECDQADIVIVGVSRTSKSPTSLYLSQRGYKVSNIPFIPRVGIGIDPEILKKSVVIGLTIAPEHLKRIRTNRLKDISNICFNGEYTDEQSIKDELQEARKLYTGHNWLTIDVSGKAVEEISAEIINYYYEKMGGHKQLSW